MGRRRGQREKHTRSLASPCRAGLDVAWRGKAKRWAQAHNMRMNGLLKSDPKPHRFTASFCCLFLLRVCV
jgi:hypothetical protein